MLLRQEERLAEVALRLLEGERSEEDPSLCLYLVLYQVGEG